ncbi:MAG: NAD(P)H-hydrate epimerase [Candidatus Omnitrophica bacterium]|nr:NAD(P)H-hydrate epimerase [Candidatus Omnitrophota bacterium]
MFHVTAAKIREIDSKARGRFAIPSLVLMENAGIAATEEILRLSADMNIHLRRIAVFSGKGNNGGDGFVVARQLFSRRIPVDVYLLAREEDVKAGETAANLKAVKALGIRVVPIIDHKTLKPVRRYFNYSAVVDAIFGTGFSGTLPPFVAEVVSFLNKTGTPVFSVDIPSGLDATTGKVYDIAVRAAATITFGLPKTGFIKADGPKHTGQVITRNISYPPQLL